MYYSHYRIIKYVGFESIIYAINIDAALSFQVFSVFEFMLFRMYCKFKSIKLFL